MTPSGRSAFTALPLGAKRYIVGIGAVAALSVGLWLADPHRMDSADTWQMRVGYLLILSVLGCVSWRLRERDVGGRVMMSFTSIILLASIPLVGTEGAALIGLLAPLASVRTARPAFTVFNCLMFSCIGSLAGWSYHAVRGPALSDFKVGAENLPFNMLHLIGALLLADVVQCLCNALILSGMYHIHLGRPFRRQLLGILRSTGLVYVGYGVIGIIFVIIWGPARVGPLTVVLVLAPLLVAQWSYGQFGNEQRSHERTLKALVTAMETKDSYVSGHSERVAELCELIGRQLSLTEQQSVALRYAGLLHDIGKLGLPTRLLRRPAPISDEETVELGTHAELGAEMLTDIEFLAESLDGVRHHHERWDGRGYPGRLAGVAIPQFARIIAVADAFDTMTTERGDRTAYSVVDALRELHSRAGIQFDPIMVQALAEGLDRSAWVVTDLATSGQRVGEAPYDHDCPITSDELAARPDLLTGIAEAARIRAARPLTPLTVDAL